MTYESFAQKCIQELKVLQDQLHEQHDLNWYDNWFYNHSTGLLTFSTDQAELNFRYIDIGSYSEKATTWLWSWDNPDTPEKVKQASALIKEFGQKSGYTKLTTGYFASDEYEAWEFAAIAAHLTNAIGVYRPVNDNQLQIFLVLTELVDNETAQQIKDKYVQCGDHDYQRLAFVCRHLNHSTKVGFHEAFETSEGMELGEDDDFQAWCDECEIVRQQEGEWNEQSMACAQIRIVCEKCYFDMKALNERSS
jgi:hypothetical protein